MSFDKDNKKEKEEENLEEDKKIEYSYEESNDSPVKTPVKTIITKKIISDNLNNINNINEGQNIVTKIIEKEIGIPIEKKSIGYKLISNPVKRYTTNEEIIEYGNEEIPFVKDDIHDLSDEKDQKNEVIVQSYEIKNDNNDNRKINRIYKKNMIKSSGINKRNKAKYESITSTTTTQTIKTTTIIKKTEDDNNENSNNVKIEKKFITDSYKKNNDINSNNSLSLSSSIR